MGNVKLLAIFFAPPHVAVCVERTVTVLRQQKKDVNVKLQRALQLWPAMPILRMQSEIRFWLVQSQISFYFRQSQISLRFLQHFTSLWRCKLSQNNDQIYWYKVHFNSPLMLTVCSPKSSRHLMFHKLICPCFQTYILVGCLDLAQYQLLPADCFTVSCFKIDFQNQAGSTHYMSPISGSVYWSVVAQCNRTRWQEAKLNKLTLQLSQGWRQ